MGLTRNGLLDLRKAAEAKYLQDVARLRACQGQLAENQSLAARLVRETDAIQSGDLMAASRAAWADRKRIDIARENEAIEMAIQKLKAELRLSAGKREAVSSLIEREEKAHQKRMEAAEDDRQAVLMALRHLRSSSAV